MDANNPFTFSNLMFYDKKKTKRKMFSMFVAAEQKVTEQGEDLHK